MYLLRIIRVARFVFRFFSIQKKYNDQFIDAYLQPFHEKYGRTISDPTLKKIKKYYCLGIPVTCNSYKKLYGKTLSDKERELATITGIITPIIDDFTDEKTLTRDRLEALTSDPKNFNATTVEEEIVKTIEIIFSENHQPSPYLKTCWKTHGLSQTPGERKVHFTNKELTVIKLLCQQYCNKEIAGRLNTTLRSVESARERIQYKIGAKNMIGVVVYAITKGIVNVKELTLCCKEYVS